MTIRDIIMPRHPDATAGARAAEDFALALAARMEAHLTALAPSFSYVLSGPNGARLPAEIREELQQRSDRRHEQCSSPSTRGRVPWGC